MSQGANENSKKEQTTSRDVGKEKQKKKGMSRFLFNSTSDWRIGLCEIFKQYSSTSDIRLAVVQSDSNSHCCHFLMIQHHDKSTTYLQSIRNGQADETAL